MSTEADKIKKRQERFAGTFDSDLGKTTLNTANSAIESEKILARQKRFSTTDGNNSTENKSKELGDVLNKYKFKNNIIYVNNKRLNLKEEEMEKQVQNLKEI